MHLINIFSRRPSGTGPVGPVMAGPTFELGRIFLKIQNKIVNFLESNYIQ